VILTEALIGKGLDVRVFDSEVSIARLVGANKEYIEREIPHIASLLVPDLAEVIAHADVLVIGNGSRVFSTLPNLVREDQVVIDLAGIKALRESRSVDYRGITW
jgi:GDP-mannose 6-dehydrogenase